MVVATLSGHHESSGGADISSGVTVHGPSGGALEGPGDGGGGGCSTRRNRNHYK